MGQDINFYDTQDSKILKFSQEVVLSMVREPKANFKLFKLPLKTDQKQIT